MILAGRVSRADGYLHVIINDELGFSTLDTPDPDKRIWGFSSDDHWERMEEEAVKFDIPTDDYWAVVEPTLTVCVEADDARNRSAKAS